MVSLKKDFIIEIIFRIIMSSSSIEVMGGDDMQQLMLMDSTDNGPSTSQNLNNSDFNESMVC